MPTRLTDITRLPGTLVPTADSHIGASTFIAGSGDPLHGISVCLSSALLVMLIVSTIGSVLMQFIATLVALFAKEEGRADQALRVLWTLRAGGAFLGFPKRRSGARRSGSGRG